MDQGFQGAAVEGVARDAIAEIGKRAEGAIGFAGADQVADGAITQVAHRREAKEDAFALGGEINPRGIHIRGHHLNAHGIAVGDIALHLVGGAGIDRQ